MVESMGTWPAIKCLNYKLSPYTHKRIRDCTTITNSSLGPFKKPCVCSDTKDKGDYEFMFAVLAKRGSLDLWRDVLSNKTDVTENDSETPTIKMWRILDVDRPPNFLITAGPTALITVMTAFSETGDAAAVQLLRIVSTWLKKCYSEPGSIEIYLYVSEAAIRTFW